MSLQSRITALANTVAADVKALTAALTGKLSNTTTTATFLGRRTAGTGAVEALSATDAKIILESANLLGSRTIVFGGTGVPTDGTNMTPLVTTTFYGLLTTARLTVKTPPTGGPLTVRVFSSANSDLSSGSQILEISITATNRTATVNIDANIAKDRFLSLDVVAVNGAADWKLEILHIEKTQP